MAFMVLRVLHNELPERDETGGRLNAIAEPIDGVAVSAILLAPPLGNTINEMEKYYTRGKL